MDTSLAILLAIALGTLVGGCVVALSYHLGRRRRQARAVLEPQLPEGIELVLAALDSIFVVTDRSHNVLRCSPGAAAAGLVQRDGRLEARTAGVLDEAMRSDAPVEREIEVPRGPFSQAALTILLRAAPIGTSFFLLLAEDRTEALRVEQVRRDFVANVSHELKTPIGAIGLLSEALEHAADDPARVRAFAGRLGVEGERLSRLTRELLELSKLQASDALDDARPVPVAQLVSAAVDRSGIAATAKGIRVTVGDMAGLVVHADAELLTSALHNLVLNAVQYSPPGSSIGIGARPVGEAVEIAVTDQGIGISEEDCSRIFERFFRADPARARDTGGTGLGLSIVKHTVEHHGGDVRVWSRLGQGSTFTVRLPLAVLPEEAAA